MNKHTPGPARFFGGELDSPDGTIIAQVTGPNRLDRREEKEANKLLLQNAFNAFDKAGRELGIDAAELAGSIDLAQLIRCASQLRKMVSNVLTDEQLDRPQLGGARAKCAKTIRETLEPFDANFSKYDPR